MVIWERVGFLLVFFVLFLSASFSRDGAENKFPWNIARSLQVPRHIDPWFVQNRSHQENVKKVDLVFLIQSRSRQQKVLQVHFTKI